MIPIRKSRQSGFGVLELLISTAILTVLILISLPALQRYQTKTEAEAFRGQIVMVWDAIKSYQADRYNTGVPFNDIASLPASFADLSPNYIQSCSVADNEAGRCSRPDLTPMNELIEMTRENVVLATGETVPGMLLTIPLGGEPSEQIRNTYRAVLADLPNGVYDEVDDKLEIRFGRVGSEVEHQGLVARDGTTKMTADTWDVGGRTWFINIMGLLLKNQDGTQQSVAAGLAHHFEAKDGDRFPVQSCPDKHSPGISVSVKSIRAFTTENKFTSLGQFNPSYKRSGSYWYVYLNYQAKLASTDKWVTLTDGYLDVILTCDLS